tara:strand:+ start:2532 stop:3515 length:984 start_codon:yes stop_codon:yes gene_type:complete
MDLQPPFFMERHDQNFLYFLKKLMNWYTKKLALSLLIILMFLTPLLSFNSGHMIDRFELIKDKKKPLLSFEGFFEPHQFLNIKINPEIKKTKTTIIIPNSYINNLLFKKGEFNSFSDDSILEKLTFNEDLTRKENGEIFSKVQIVVYTKDKHTLEFDTENSDSRRLTFSIKNVKKKLVSTFDEIEVKMPEKIENDLQVLKENRHKTLLLHPITALMSYRKFDQIKISVLNASPNIGAAHRLSTMLDRQQKKNIEKDMGMNLKIINISSVSQETILKNTKIYFHPNFLKAALILAEFIPGEQVLEPFPESRKRKNTSDLQIFVGKNFE